MCPLRLSASLKEQELACAALEKALWAKEPENRDKKIKLAQRHLHDGGAELKDFVGDSQGASPLNKRIRNAKYLPDAVSDTRNSGKLPLPYSTALTDATPTSAHALLLGMCSCTTEPGVELDD